MTTYITRAGKGAALTHGELDERTKLATQTKAANYTVIESDNRDTIEVSATATITLPDAATIVAASDTGDFEVTLNEDSGNTITISRATGADTIGGTASDITFSNQSIALKVNQAGDGYNIVSDGLKRSSLINAIYPVGAIFSSTVNVSPASLFGGTWTSLQGMVLMAEDGTSGYVAGNTGGSKDAVNVSHTHADTFAVDSDGAHTHDVDYDTIISGSTTALTGRNDTSTPENESKTTSSAGDHTHGLSGSVASAGVSGTNANMPPYLAVYMWERAA